MMYLRRCLLVRLGPSGPSGVRFDPVELSFVDERGVPCHSGLLLENGGGKTTLISWVFASLDPRPSRFIATKRTSSHRMGDYVTAGSVAHVICEWAVPLTAPTLDGDAFQTKVTGLVMTGRGPNVLPDRRVYGFRSTPTLSFDSLPHGAGERSYLGAADYMAAIRTAAEGDNNLYDHPATTDRWAAWLRGEHIDPDLIEMQANMNSQESGAASLLKDNGNVWTFTQRLLELTADAASDAAVAAIAALHDKAQHTASRRQELDAFTAVSDPLANAAIMLDDLSQALGRRDQSARAAVELAGRLTRSAATLDDLAVGHGNDRQAAESRRAAAETARAAWNKRYQWARRTQQDYRVQRVTQAARDAAQTAEEAERGADAWNAVEDVIELRAARQDRERIRTEIDDAHTTAAPYQQALDRRIAVALGTIAHLDADYRGRAATARQDAATAIEGRNAVEAELEGLAAQEATIVANLTAARDALDALNADIDARIAAGDLHDRDVVGATDARRVERADAETESARLREVHSGMGIGLTELRSRHAKANGLLTSAQSTHALARQRIATVDKAVAQVAARAGFADITDTGSVLGDLDAVLAMTSHRESEARDRLADIDDRLSRLRSERARLDGLVEVDADVEAAVASLRRQRVSAHAGWEHIADSDAVDRTRLATRRPGMANGIVVTGTTPTDAAAKLAGVTVDRAIVITQPDAPHDHNGVDAVLLPEPHRYDPDAATARKAELDEQIRADADDAERTRSAAKNWSSLHLALEGLTGLGAERAAAADSERDAAEVIGRHRATMRDLDGRIDTAQEELASVSTSIDILDTTARQATTELEWLIPLAERAGRARTWRTTIDDSDTRLADIRSARPDLTRRRDALEGTASDLRAKAAAWVTSAERLLTEAVSHSLDPDGDAARVDPADLVPLERLYVDIQRLRDKVKEVSPTDGLREELQTAETRVGQATTRLAPLTKATRAHAEELADTTDAHDAFMRQRRIADATERRRVAQHRSGEAATAMANAERDLAALPHGERPSEQYHLPIPTSEQDAAQVVTTAERLSTDAAAAARSAQEQRDIADGKARDCTQRATVFRTGATTLTNTLADRGLDVPEPLPDTGPFPGDAAAAKTAAAGARRQLGATSEAVTAAREQAHEAREAVLAVLADHDGFPQRLAEQMRLAVNVSHADVLRVADEVDKRIAALTVELESFDTERDHMVAEIAGAAGSVLSLLDRMSRMSTMHGDLGDWTGKKFILVNYDREAKKDLAAPTRRVLDELLSTDAAPDRLEHLLVRILQLALGPTGLRVKMLKPNSELDCVYNQIEEFSGSEGQKLTAAILLYCVLSRIRSERTASTGRGPGALWLDNPFGQANQTTLVDLQRRMADALEVQLIYCTGIADPNAVAHLHRWTHMKKQLNRATNDRHLTVVSTGRTLPQVDAFTAYQRATTNVGSSDATPR
ncbi:hypothetical protein [Euzebya rosea]|uniref:hypothetical protein n=1 Tax=Euzebya rosea TaxID=2052804 RepID=UPI0013001E8B|nr:hypothetical protein [Euzebya rosea]